MNRAELLTLILGSAGLGALISSILNAVGTWLIRRQELMRQDEQFALSLVQMKHQQLLAAQEWRIKETGKPQSVDLWDPLVTAISYVRGVKEFRRTGWWKKGEGAHIKKSGA